MRAEIQRGGVSAQKEMKQVFSFTRAKTILSAVSELTFLWGR